MLVSCCVHDDGDDALTRSQSCVFFFNKEEDEEDFCRAVEPYWIGFNATVSSRYDLLVEVV